VTFGAAEQKADFETRGGSGQTGRFGQVQSQGQSCTREWQEGRTATKGETMKIAIYARVSTDKQDNENQLVQLRDFAAKQGWIVVAEYVDRESGAKSDRVEFQRMFADASKRKFDLVCSGH
jgi:predicted site-specific integrase-resolvase